MRREKSLEPFIPYASSPAPGVVVGKKGEFHATFRCAGVPFETVGDEEIDAGARQLNLFLRSLPPGTSVVVHRVRRRMSDRLGVPLESGFARDFALRVNEEIGSRRLMATEFFITLVVPGGGVRLRKETLEKRRTGLMARIRAFENLCSGTERALSAFGARRLTCREEGKRTVSDQLAFLNFLLSLEWTPVRASAAPLPHVLGSADVFLSADLLEVVRAGGSRTFAQGLEIKDFCSWTTPGLLDELLYPDIASVDPYEFIETQTFRVMGRADAQSFLSTQQGRLLSSGDAGLSQIEGLTLAMDGLASGEFVLGEYSYGLLVLGATEAEARRNTLDAAEKLKKAGLLPIQSGLALGGLFFSQLPGNFTERPRVAALSSQNFAHFAPFHNLPCGKRDHNPWGEAVMMLRTPSDQPYYFNFHSTPLLEKSEGRKAPASTVVIGTAGSGKTVFLNTALAMAQKYRTEATPMTCVFFDKDRGAEIALRAMGGTYLTVENGRPTGFNPFALEPTEANIAFLTTFVRLLVTTNGKSLGATEELRLSEAVRAVMAMPLGLRRLGLLPQNLVEGLTREERESSLTKRLARWVDGGDLAWVFDNPVDEIDFSRAPVFGIDGTEFLENREVRTPVAFYLLYRMESVIDGRRFLFVMDEFWKWLSDAAFRDFAFNKLKTIRKQNGFGVFATQSPADVLESPIAKAVVEQAATLVFLPNPRAAAEDYIGGFKLTDSEFEIVRSLGESSRQMLVKQDHGSVVCRLDLSNFPNELLVLSGSTENTELLDRIRAEVGDDPHVWLPVFLERAGKKRKEQKKEDL